MGEELRKLWKTEDYWAVWLGLGIVFLALVVYSTGGTIAGAAQKPGESTAAGPASYDVGAMRALAGEATRKLRHWRTLREMLDVARETGVALQISHFIFVGRRS